MDAVILVFIGIAIALMAVWAHDRLAGFTSQSPLDYAEGRAGQFDLREHLNGPMLCEGVIYGPTGRVSTRFEADFFIEWQGGTGVMRERFHYDDGSIQDRAWYLDLSPDGTIVAEADDVIGKGRGIQSGDSVQLKYRIRLPEASGGHVLDVVDWMYLAPNGTIINRSQFRKFGIKVAELVATMRPNQAEERHAA